MANTQSDYPLTLAEVLYDELKVQHPTSAKKFDGQISAIRTDTTWQGRCDRSTALVREIYVAIHNLGKDDPANRRSALCLSGGGVRSAVFNLGILQGLARSGLLEKFEYLSTVSGGGFIGSWLSAWIHREGGDVGKVAARLADPPTNPLEPQAGPLYTLRIYANYLTPRKGLFGVDTWTLIAVYLRNLLLNWLVFVPVIMGLLMLPRIWVAFVRSQYLSSGTLVGIGFALAALALVYIGTNLPGAKRWNFRERWFLIFCLMPLVASAMALTTYWVRLDKDSKPKQSYFIVFALLLGAVPWVIYVVSKILSWRRDKKEAQAEQRRHPGPLPLTLGRYLLATVLVLAAFAITGALTWYVGNIKAVKELNVDVAFARTYASLAVPFLLILLTIGGTLIAGFTSSFTDVDDQEWWARSGSWILIVVLGWTVFHLLVLVGPTLFVGLQRSVYEAVTKQDLTLLDIKGIAKAVGGVAAVLLTVFGGKSSKTPAQGEHQQASWKTKLPSIALSVAGVVGGIFIVIVLALATNFILAGVFKLDANDPKGIIYGSTFGKLVLWAFLISLVGGIFGLLINTNRFSLHYYWRDRLMRAYLGPSRNQKERLTTKNNFTDFDLKDNVQMYGLTVPGSNKPQKPLHVVNVTLNLAGGAKMEWQDRKAESFSISPLHAGSYWLGYRDARHYGGDDGISLATSVAISGAAASPNMGYMMSSPIVRFIMTLFNVRLGFWLGNPGIAGGRTFDNDSPTQSVRPIFAEALGLTNDKSPYVYLSDGGHFDNFGLYEMILRRCRFIVIGDASTDPDYRFESLAYSIRQVRVDFGVPIEMRQDLGRISEMHFGRQPDKANRYCAIFDIRYSCVDKPGSTDPDPDYDGVLIYIKPSLDGTEPADVLNYHKADDAFPQDTIVDQWFSEPQFESYRMLGSHMIQTISPKKITDADPLGKFEELAKTHLGMK